MAHKKGLLKKYLTDPEETDSSFTNKSPIHDGKTWIIPETSNSDNEICEEKNGKMNLIIVKVYSKLLQLHHQYYIPTL